jgi:hypothetical protein
MTRKSKKPRRTSSASAETDLALVVAYDALAFLNMASRDLLTGEEIRKFRRDAFSLLKLIEPDVRAIVRAKEDELQIQ